MTAYEITTPVAGFTGTVAGVEFVKGSGSTSSLGALAYFRRHGYKVVPAVTDPSEDGGGDGKGPGAGERPARSANKATWVAWAVACGADQGEAEATTKDDLIDAYGGDD